ncbi:Hypothetical protein FKW44_006256 [Caligus rogercresseyi]|uniref:Uncharacterized protein n=1 Tax=Caligus rogercresseyi TaxID=217165 RepID=A0A7T8KD59_CALRO|nr:Hypothetical protein FKW44_006256 [Caligus rogercresseyi]
MINSFKRGDEGKAVEWFKQFGEVLRHYPKKNPLDKDAEKKYGSYKDIWRDGDYIVEIIAIRD